MKRFILLFITTLVCELSAVCATPAGILKAAASQLNKNRGVNCSFTAKNSDGNMKGNLWIESNKFIISTQNGTTWYDGKAMYTANKSTSEITITEPTASEIAETNPLYYIQGYEKQYNIFFSKRKDASRYLVLLNPKQRNTGIKAIEIAINKKTNLPERVIIRGEDDKITTILISGLKFGGTTIDAQIANKKREFSKYEMVDLR